LEVTSNGANKTRATREGREPVKIVAPHEERKAGRFANETCTR